MIGSGIAFNPCCKCDEKGMCNICELTYRRNGQLADSADIAKEIFAELETSFIVSGCHDGSFFYEIRVEDYNHYKKKYTENEVAERREDIENSPADCSTPSVTDQKGEEKMKVCKDCVHFEACVDFLFSDYDCLDNIEQSKQKHANDEACVRFKATTDFVEVVRCKDCQHFKDEGVNGQYCQYHTKNAGENCDGAFWVAKNDYCSYGERRENSDKTE